MFGEAIQFADKGVRTACLITNLPAKFPAGGVQQNISRVTIHIKLFGQRIVGALLVRWQRRVARKIHLHQFQILPA